MNKTITNFLAALTLLFIFLNTSPVQAQDEIDKFLEAGLVDANILAEGYMKPFMLGFGAGLANGWYNTAKAHKSAGFDLTVTVNAAYVPDDDLFYSPQFNTLTYNPSGPQRSPTLFGPDGADNKPIYDYAYTENVNGTDVDFTGSFQGPEGVAVKDNIGIQAVPVPMVQLGIGIVKNTDLKIRWSPTVDVGDNGEFKLIGFGIMHDIKQHIKGIKDLPFDLSAMVAFTNVSLEYDLAAESDPLGTVDEVTTDDGLAEFKVNTWTIQGIISKKISVLTFYGGLGYNIIKSNLSMKGTYQIDDGVNPDPRIYIDPLDLTFKQSGPRLTAGMRLKLAIFTFHADYTVQKYNTLSVGFGFNVR